MDVDAGAAVAEETEDVTTGTHVPARGAVGGGRRGTARERRRAPARRCAPCGVGARGGGVGAR